MRPDRSGVKIMTVQHAKYSITDIDVLCAAEAIPTAEGGSGSCPGTLRSPGCRAPPLLPYPLEARHGNFHYERNAGSFPQDVEENT